MSRFKGEGTPMSPCITFKLLWKLGLASDKTCKQGVSLVQRAYTSKELMEIDDKIMQEYQQMRSKQKLASEEAKRAREYQRRHPPKRHGYTTNSLQALAV